MDEDRKRRHDWRARLVDELARSTYRPFAWGSNDCALFAMRCVEAMTGDNPGRAYAGRYKTARSAASVIRRAGHADLVALAGAHFPSIHPSQANTGDLAAVQTEHGPALGIFGSDRIHTMGATGMGTVPRTDAIAALKV